MPRQCPDPEYRTGAVRPRRRSREKRQQAVQVSGLERRGIGRVGIDWWTAQPTRPQSAVEGIFVTGAIGSRLKSDGQRTGQDGMPSPCSAARDPSIPAGTAGARRVRPKFLGQGCHLPSHQDGMRTVDHTDHQHHPRIPRAWGQGSTPRVPPSRMPTVPGCGLHLPRSTLAVPEARYPNRRAAPEQASRPQGSDGWRDMAWSGQASHPCDTFQRAAQLRSVPVRLSDVGYGNSYTVHAIGT